MGIESSLGKKEFGPGEHDKTKEASERAYKWAEGIMEWWKRVDSPKTGKSPEGVKEKKEGVAEKIVEDRASLFQRVISRVLEGRGQVATVIQNLPEEERRLWEKARNIPVVGSGFVVAEGVFGAEPGKKLNTKDALTKAGTGYLMFGRDVISLISRLKTGVAPGNVFEGKTIEWGAKLAKEAEEKDPRSNKAQVLRAVNGFLQENSDTVSYYENSLNEAAKRGAAA